jgi:hypothetical protein
MAVISANTFNALHRYVSVRLQQGVPLVDADWNEMEDIRQFELRAFLKWFVGDGIPDGSNGFEISATGDADNFTIQAGGSTDGLNAGRCLVDGQDVFITDDVNFTDQPLHNSQPGAAELAALAGGVPVIANVPPGAATLMIYLDVWMRLVTIEEAPDLVHPGLGIESCVRNRREWAVRVRDGTAVPASGDADFIDGHSYYALALVDHAPGDPITADTITDLRRRGLTVQPRGYFDQIARDTFGSAYTLNTGGQPTLPFSLRAVVNAMLRSGRPALIGPEILVTAAPPHWYPTSAVDDAGNQWLFWLEGSNLTEIHFQRQVDGHAWQPPALLRTINGQSAGLAAVAAAGMIWLFWSDQVNANQWDIFGQVFRNGAWESQFLVSAGTTNLFNLGLSAGATSADEVMVVWLRQDLAPSTIFFSRLFTADPTVAGPITQVSEDYEASPAVVVDVDDTIHVYGLIAGAPPAGIQLSTWQPGPATWTAPADPLGVPMSVSAGDAQFAAMSDRFGGTWLLYANGASSLTGRYLRPGATPDPEAVLVETESPPSLISAMRDAQGNVQVFFVVSLGPGNTEVHRLNLVTEV